jgi:hypothetical protein
MSSNFNKKQYAPFHMGKALTARGFTLYGYRPDHDHTTWDGVATKDGCVLCVWADQALSGYREMRTIREPGDPCEACAGTGACPGGATHEEAQRDPKRYHRLLWEQQLHPGARIIMSGISPHDYFEDGRSKCLLCHGRGHQLNQRDELVRVWPTFQPSPATKAWHVEREGIILAAGTMTKECYSSGPPRKAALARIIDQIEAAIDADL